VVEAVLVMALVTTIGILVIASRVAGSRESASSSSLNLAARQAAEFGFAEVVAEMNRDPKSYLWVTKFSQWNNVSLQDLRTCGVAASANPVSNPISSLGSTKALPNSPELSYRFVSYQEPANPDEEGTESVGCNNKFGNLIGGTGEIEIVGTMKRASGYTSTFTLKRKVSVKRAAPIFNNPITAIPANRSFDPADSRFPNYLDAADPTKVAYPGTPTGGTPVPITCEPNGSSPIVIKCTSGSLSDNFKSAAAPGVDNRFPYLPDGSIWETCKQVGVPPNDVVRCFISSMTVKDNANMAVDTTTRPVEIFLSGDMTITSGSRLSGDNWSRFRIFGVTSGTSCGSQTITIDSFNNIALTPATVEPNLQNAFLWLSKGRLKYQSSTALTSIPALVGSVCQFESAVAGPANLSTLSNRRFLEGLGGAYSFSGLFGAPTPIRFFYRGFGSED
jgi:hypothetical protein